MIKGSNRMWLIIVVVAVVAGVIGTVFGLTRPFQGEFDRKCLIQLKGELTAIKSFEDTVKHEFKWIAAYKVSSAEYLHPERCVLTQIQPDDIISLDMEDSRVNLLVDSKPTTCFQDTETGSPKRTCTYTITQSKPVILMTEDIGSSGLPEPNGSPR